MKVKVQELLFEIDILDTGGADEFKLTRDSIYKARDGFILVYDVSYKESFLKLDAFLSSILERKKDGVFSTYDKIPVLLVGNKTDLEKNN